MPLRHRGYTKTLATHAMMRRCSAETEKHCMEND
jgi:hypothetical protein